MKKPICILVLGISFIFIAQKIMAQGISDNIKEGELIKDKQSNTATYINNECGCSFKIPYNWILIAHNYNQQSNTVNIVFAKYNIVGSVLHGAENQLVSLGCYIGALNKISLENFIKILVSGYKDNLQPYNIRSLGQDTISINGNMAIRRAKIAGGGAESARSLDYFFAKNNNIYFLSVNVAPGKEEDGFSLPAELEEIVNTLQIK